MTLCPPRDLLCSLFEAAIAAAQPERVLASCLPVAPAGRTLVVGAGKASAAMARAIEALWPAQAPLSGLVVTRRGHVPPSAIACRSRIEIVEASHPVPDEGGVQAARRIAAMTQGLGRDDLVLCLMSGGGSSVLALPADGLTLRDKQRINEQLLRSGASIVEMNSLRKHLSAIKGGRLAAMCAPARVLTLAISDVPGDDMATIASGPTVPDATTCADALSVAMRYGIGLPAAALEGLRSGLLETPKPGDACFARCESRLIATPQMSLDAAAAVAREAGIAAHVLGDRIEGEARDVGRAQAALALHIASGEGPYAAPCVLLSGGETTVTLAGAARAGRGGRNTEFLLGCAIALQGHAGIWALAGDTDGIDGSESNAGAIATPHTLARAAALGLDAEGLLDGHDAWRFFDALGDLVVTGPTFTNVNDFRALLVLREDRRLHST